MLFQKKPRLSKGKSDPKLNVTQSATDLNENVSFQIPSQVWLQVFEATGGFGRMLEIRLL